MSTASEVGTYLAAHGLGTVGTSIFEGLMPASPANCIGILERAGRGPERTMGRLVAVKPHVHIEVRNDDYEAGYAVALQIQTLLQNFTGLMGSVRYYEITIMGAINSLGVDENQRSRFTQTFIVTKEPS